MLKIHKNQLLDDSSGELIELSNLSDQELSDHYKEIMLRFKALESIADKLKREMRGRLSEGQRKFADFWDIQWINNKFTGIDLKKLEAEDPDLVDTLKKNYSKFTSYVVIKFPKM